jgi:AmmeMemoRadiSam system protein A
MLLQPKPVPGPTAEPSEYSPEERRALLRLARQAMQAALVGDQPELSAPSHHLAQPRGAFTTLHLDGKLRGCVGYVFPVRPLYRTVVETAVAAALNDPRFLPVIPEEFPDLEIEISVLSMVAAIAPADLEIGRHGVLITYGARRGLLLPQVALEYGWDAARFLAETCQKAGLPPDAWENDATVEAFTAEVFSEAEFADLASAVSAL